MNKPLFQQLTYILFHDSHLKEEVFLAALDRLYGQYDYMN